MREIFMKTTDGKISFENIIITPLERWINTDFDLDENAIQALNQLAEIRRLFLLHIDHCDLKKSRRYL